MTTYSLLIFGILSRGEVDSFERLVALAVSGGCDIHLMAVLIIAVEEHQLLIHPILLLRASF